ncbi:MAG: Biotin--protein ligase [Burkholderiaceae bacterium]|jgi:BirA family biotin operon repressor/biotin-[acetyl-CoA-carboxylase] ligase|nr:MAG: Biotin--protein ligase [Burkholderiaceae bacterium]
MTVLWPEEEIARGLRNARWPGLRLERLATIDSTNSELMRRARAGRLESVLLVAGEQTAGRGRLGRPWASRADASLTFSLGLPLAPANWSGLSLAVGVGIAERLHPAIRIKWPNDLWLCDGRGERKLAGILVESANFGAASYVVIGVGLNIAADAAQGVAAPAGWLQELLPGMVASQALALFAPGLLEAVRAFETDGFAPFVGRFDARDLLRGREISMDDGSGATLHGTACGVAESGALLVHTGSGMRELIGSEVSVRPLAGWSATRGGAAA